MGGVLKRLIFSYLQNFRGYEFEQEKRRVLCNLHDYLSWSDMQSVTSHMKMQ